MIKKSCRKRMALLSVIVPCYNEEENVKYFYDELMKNQPFFEKKKLDVEIIYVDDGSKDKTVEEVKKLREKAENVHLISFSRFFSKITGKGNQMYILCLLGQFFNFLYRIIFRAIIHINDFYI